jgi:hypothetical protein
MFVNIDVEIMFQVFKQMLHLKSIFQSLFHAARSNVMPWKDIILVQFLYPVMEAVIKINIRREFTDFRSLIQLMNLTFYSRWLTIYTVYT